MSCNLLSSDGTGNPGNVSAPRLEAVESLAKKIRLLVLDVDGVMTDGGLYYDANGLVMKRFDVHDGIGIRLAKAAGIEVAVLSGMDVPCVVRRLEVLGVTEYHGGADNKCTILDAMRRRLSLEWSEIAYLGDDWVDLAPLSRVGLPAAVDNAMPDVKKLARFVTRKSGGHGAVREFVDLLLTCQGKRDALLEHWMRLE
ncbi:HAD family hydrolase [uncultured Bilophila sp.]|uniref:KdsC family phosphatase n=1 Tax=uncultured Bilophila sp. TaxID=529385 RepID=UPI0026DB5284|nr:HAD hydrolase family protein [uncultured Bilophila sp.]